MIFFRHPSLLKQEQALEPCRLRGTVLWQKATTSWIRCSSLGCWRGWKRAACWKWRGRNHARIQPSTFPWRIWRHRLIPCRARKHRRLCRTWRLCFPLPRLQTPHSGRSQWCLPRSDLWIIIIIIIIIIIFNNYNNNKIIIIITTIIIQ